LEYLNGEISNTEMIEKIKTETRRYAKRQITWFKKYKEIIWLLGDDDIDDNINLIIKHI